MTNGITEGKRRLVCCHCGGEDFHADVTYSGEAWVDSEGVFVGDDGEPHFESLGGVQDAYQHDYDIDSVVCSTCSKSVPERLLADLVRFQLEGYKAGDRVTLPDGLDATIEALGPDRPLKPTYGSAKPRMCQTVIAGGLEFFAHEVTPIPPNPDQLALAAA